MFAAAVVLALPAWLLSVLASVRAGIPLVTWASTAAYGWLIAVRFAPRVGYRVKAVSLIVVMHFVGLSLLTGLGPVGPGLMWLMAATVTAAALLHPREARLAFGVHLLNITLATLYFLSVPTDLYAFPYNGLGWFATAAGSLLLCGILAVAVGALVADLGRVIDGQSAEHVRLQAETARRARLEAELEQRVAKRTADLAAANTELERQKMAIEQADRVKSEFLSTMSHELRTPLNSVIGFSDLLLEMDSMALPGKQRRYVEAIRKAGHHQLALITELLDHSKIEAGHLRLTPSALAVGPVLASACDVIAPQASTKRIVILPHSEPALWVLADPARLHQILLNLLSNAVKFGPDGSTVTITAAATGGLVGFEVRDEGPGVPAEMWPRLFQPFQQAESSFSRRHEGTGLGLAICRRLVEAQGGQIAARPGAPVGLVVAFTLPAAADPGSAEAPAVEEPSGIRAGPGLRRVLIVDDHEPNRALVRAILEAREFTVIEADSGLAALDLARRGRPALILMDIAMPGMDGLEATRRLKLDPATSAIPVVAISALASSSNEGAAADAGVHAFLSKPLNGAKLIRTIRQALGDTPR